MAETPRYRRTFFPLLGFLRPYKVSLAISTVFAVGYQASLMFANNRISTLRTALAGAR